MSKKQSLSKTSLKKYVKSPGSIWNEFPQSVFDKMGGIVFMLMKFFKYPVSPKSKEIHYRIMIHFYPSSEKRALPITVSERKCWSEPAGGNR